MAINLLGGLQTIGNDIKQGVTDFGQFGTPQSRFAPVNYAQVAAQKTPAPMGVTAKTPAANVSAPAATLPKTQQNPVTAPAAQPLASVQTPAYNPASDPTYNPTTGGTASHPTYATPNPSGDQTGYVMNGNDQMVPAGSAGTTTPTFSGLLSQAVNQQNSPYNTTAMNNINQTAQYGAGNIPIGQSAADIASNYGQQIANVGQKGAAFESGQLTTGTSPVAEGNAAVTANTTANQQNALATGEQAALQGTAQQLTAQNQAANASNAAAGQSLTGQGQTYGALQSAASLAQPSTAAYGQTTFNPVTGQYTDGGGLPASVLQQYASMAANGQYSAIPASITGNPVLSAQLNQAAAAINPNYNPITSAAIGQGQAAVASAPYGAQANNINTQNTTGTNIAASGATQAVQQYNALNAANTTFDNQASQVLSVLQQGSLNGSIPDVNKAINQLGGKLGSTQVQALSSSLTELGAAYTNLLSSNGGTPTAQDQQALAALSPNSSAAQIATSIAQLKAAAQIKLQSQQALAQGYSNSLGGSTGNMSSTSGFGWNG